MELVIGLIIAIVVICKINSEATEKKLPGDYHNNWRLEAEDCNKVRFGQMSKKQFLKNMENGKYR